MYTHRCLKHMMCIVYFQPYFFSKMSCSSFHPTKSAFIVLPEIQSKQTAEKIGFFFHLFVSFENNESKLFLTS